MPRYNFNYSKLAIALSHAILDDQVNYRMQKEDEAASAAAREPEVPAEDVVVIDAGGA